MSLPSRKRDIAWFLTLVLITLLCVTLFAMRKERQRLAEIAACRPADPLPVRVGTTDFTMPQSFGLLLNPEESDVKFRQADAQPDAFNRRPYCLMHGEERLLASEFSYRLNGAVGWNTPDPFAIHIEKILFAGDLPPEWHRGMQFLSVRWLPFSDARPRGSWNNDASDDPFYRRDTSDSVLLFSRTPMFRGAHIWGNCSKSQSVRFYCSIYLRDPARGLRVSFNIFPDIIPEKRWGDLLIIVDRALTRLTRG